MRGIITVLTAVLLCGSALGGTPEESHPFTVRDLLAMQRISEPQVSPSGLWIVFTVQTPDLEAGKGRTDLWVVGTNGEGLRQLTTHAEADGGALVGGQSYGGFLVVTKRLVAGVAYRYRRRGGSAGDG